MKITKTKLIKYIIGMAIAVIVSVEMNSRAAFLAMQISLIGYLWNQPD